MTELAVLQAAGSGEFRELWSRFVLNHPEAGLGHLPENFDIAEAKGVKNHSVAVLGDQGQVRGVLPLFEIRKQQLRLFPVRELVSGVEFPAQPLCAAEAGAGRAAAIEDALLTAAETTAARIGADTLAITYPIVTGAERSIDRHGCCPLRSRRYADQSFAGLLLSLDGDLGGKLKKSCRNAIGRAVREGCETRPIGSFEEWMQCRDLAQQTLGDAAETPGLHAACWKIFVERGYARTYAVTCPLSPEIQALVVTALWRHSCYYWKNFSRRPARIPGVNNLALWRAIEDAQRSGVKWFELGSMDCSNPKMESISQYKASFGGDATYLLRGVRELRPLRRSALDFAGNAYAAVRSRLGER